MTKANFAGLCIALKNAAVFAYTVNQLNVKYPSFLRCRPPTFHSTYLFCSTPSQSMSETAPSAAVVEEMEDSSKAVAPEFSELMDMDVVLFHNISSPSKLELGAMQEDG